MKNQILQQVLQRLTEQAQQCLPEELDGAKMSYNRLDIDTIKKVIESMKDVDYKNIDLTEEEKAAGWKISHCAGNGYKRGCGKAYRTLTWFNPSGCPHCSATFVD